MLPSELVVLLLHVSAVGAGLRGLHTTFCWQLEGLLNLRRRFSVDRKDRIRAERSHQQWERPGQCHLMKPEDLGHCTAMHD